MKRGYSAGEGARRSPSRFGNRLSRFILAGLLFAAFPGEISNQLLIHRSARGFVITMANYVWFLAVAYTVSRWLERWLATRYAARRAYFFFYGILGLFIEWCLLGVYPFLVNPVQLLLFSFWAGMAILPCLFTDEPVTSELSELRRRLRRYMVVWAAVALLPFMVAWLFAPQLTDPARNFSMLVFGIGVVGVHVYTLRYFRWLKAQGDSSQKPVASSQ